MWLATTLAIRPPPSIHPSMSSFFSLHQKLISYFLPSFCLFDSRAEQTKSDPATSALLSGGFTHGFFFAVKTFPPSGILCPGSIYKVSQGFGTKFEGKEVILQSWKMVTKYRKAISVEKVPFAVTVRVWHVIG